MTNFEIGCVLETQQSFQLDVGSVVTGRTFIASITRWGKSWTCRKIIEECFGHAGIILIDPEGEYSSLREKFPFLIIGKDVPLQVETAEFMAEKTLESKISVIIDTSMVEDDEAAKEYIDRFLRKFFFLETALRQPYLVVVEEAEDFAPERGIASETTLRILINIVKKGGKRGIGALFVAHRPAWVSKGILSQCANKAIGKIESTDFEALEKYARVPRSIIEGLPKLGKGEFCFVGDWVNDVSFVKVGPVKTTHLGFTPEVVPPSPKELQTVIEALQKTLPEVIQKVKPTVVSTSEIENKIRTELERKFKNRTESTLKTADEKAERKYRVEIDKLKTHIDQISRSQALQSTAIADVLDHPIVKSRMLQLPDRARDILVKIEREPGLTREQLAAFLSTSKDTVAGLIEKINQVFHAQAVIGDGKPVRYKSLLKRLYLTDVAKREIEELKRLQIDNKQKTERIASLEKLAGEMHSTHSEVERLRKDLEDERNLKERFKKEFEEGARIIEQIEQTVRSLKDQNAAYQKLKEALSTLGVATPNASVDLKEVQAYIDEKVKEAAAQNPMTVPASNGQIPTSVELEHKVTCFDFKPFEEHVAADTTTLQGCLIFLVLKGFFNARHKRSEIAEELSNNGWVHKDQDIDQALLDLCQKGFFYRKISTSKYMWYSLQPEAKELIHT